MLDGLQRDDIYIMVEDEFHAVAKQFTQHLHHAEYVRLKNLAKSKNASTITTISRPTDSITVMRGETRKRKEGETMAAKQKVALERIKGKAAAKRPKVEATSESDIEVTKEDDPWIGTTLQGLMASPINKQISLAGIQGVLSSTRAAAGYSKPPRRISQNKVFGLESQTTFEPTAETSGSIKNTPFRMLGTEEDETTTEDDDNLDAPIARKHLSRQSNLNISLKTSKTAKSIDTHLLASPSPSLQSIYSHPTSKSVLKRDKTTSNPTFFDQLPEAPGLESEVSNRLVKRQAGLRTWRETGADTIENTGSINEIPIFLV